MSMMVVGAMPMLDTVVMVDVADDAATAMPATV
jgi:hypothetical protein